MDHNVFICWSAERSRCVALAMREWLPSVVQAARPWMSETDLDKGTLWRGELSKKLGAIKLGIVCLTPENLSSPWIHFESGAIAKAVDDRSRVCTYLFADLKPEDISSPLADFNHTCAVEDDTLKLVNTVNAALGEPVPPDVLRKVFDRSWPDLERALKAALPVESAVAKRRTAEEMLAELLDLARAETKRRSELDPFKDVLDDLLPVLKHWLKIAKPEIARFLKEQQDSLPPGTSPS